MKWTALIACGVWLACPTTAGAHRLDEYLQATRIALAPDNVRVEIDLTPGINVAPRVTALIDFDGDGALSPAERHAYAALVVRLTDLQIDGRPAPLIVVERTPRSTTCGPEWAPSASPPARRWRPRRAAGTGSCTRTFTIGNERLSRQCPGPASRNSDHPSTTGCLAASVDA